MPGVTAKVAERLSVGVKKFQPVIADAKSRDVAESDTVTIVTDMFSEVFGYKKYSEITSEHAIRGTYCDLALTVESKLRALVEVKAVGSDLKDSHVKQAVDYAANQGVEWVILTNAAIWRIYKVFFEKPINQELIAEIDFLSVKPKSEDDLDMLYLICKEAWSKSALDEYGTQREALGRYTLGALILGDAILKDLKRELRRLCPDVKIDTEDIRKSLEVDVLKREIIEGDKADAARKAVAKAASKPLRQTKADESES